MADNKVIGTTGITIMPNHDPSQVAKWMLEWEEKKKDIDALEARIRNAVLQMGKTQTVGNVTASYSGGRRTFEYEKPVLAARGKAIEEGNIERIKEINVAIDMHTVTQIKTNFRNVCETLGIEGELASKSDPSVTLKLT